MGLKLLSNDYVQISVEIFSFTLPGVSTVVEAWLPFVGSGDLDTSHDSTIPGLMQN